MEACFSFFGILDLRQAWFFLMFFHKAVLRHKEPAFWYLMHSYAYAIKENYVMVHW
jgi:hypothetical protein